MSFNKF